MNLFFIYPGRSNFLKINIKKEKCSCFDIFYQFINIIISCCAKYNFGSINPLSKTKQLKYSLNEKGTVRAIFNDPDIWRQWYLIKQDNSSGYLSHELDTLWEKGITGKGITIGIIDGGIDFEHMDIKDNFRKEISYNFVTNSTEIYFSSFGCSTECAGIISAVANNNKCGVGVAPSSHIACLQIFDDDNKFLNMFWFHRAITYNVFKIDIYVIYLNYYDEYSLDNGFLYTMLRSLSFGIKYGRNKLGTIYVMGSGEWGLAGDNCAYKWMQQRHNLLAFGSITANGLPPVYLEKCTSILASALSTEKLSRKDQIFSTTCGNLCENSVGGIRTSISIAAGIIALLLSDNPTLTYRQVMLLIILTSTQYDIHSVRNAAGFYYSYSNGFGMLNAKELIRSSRNDSIANLSELHTCKTHVFYPKRVVIRGSYIKFQIYTSGCNKLPFCITEIEQIFLVFSIETSSQSSISMWLTSPSGTNFTILLPRLRDVKRERFNNFRIRILGYFGERSAGVWTLKIFSNTTNSYFHRIELIMHGTCNNPALYSDLNTIVKKFIQRSKPIRNSLITRPYYYSKIHYYNNNEQTDIFSFSDSYFKNIIKINYLIHF